MPAPPAHACRAPLIAAAAWGADGAVLARGRAGDGGLGRRSCQTFGLYETVVRRHYELADSDLPPSAFPAGGGGGPGPAGPAGLARPYYLGPPVPVPPPQFYAAGPGAGGGWGPGPAQFPGAGGGGYGGWAPGAAGPPPGR
jgi:hypothetical protein